MGYGVYAVHRGLSILSVGAILQKSVKFFNKTLEIIKRLFVKT